jgi:hypothetical protein
MAGKFEPKVPVQLAPPKDDLISLQDLAKANGTASHPRPFKPSLNLHFDTGGLSPELLGRLSRAPELELYFLLPKLN